MLAGRSSADRTKDGGKATSIPSERRDCPSLSPFSLILFQKAGQLVERSAPTLLHAVAAFVESLALELARLVRRPAHRHLGLARALLLEFHRRHRLQRPVRVPWM